MVHRKTNTATTASMLFDDGDTPRHILKNILMTGIYPGLSFITHHDAAVCCPYNPVICCYPEPVRSPVVHKKTEAEEPQPSSANASITSKRLR